MCLTLFTTPELQKSVDSICQFLLVVIAILVFISVVWTIAQAQVTQFTGDRIGHAHTLQQGIYVIGIAVLAASYTPISETFQSFLCPKAPVTTGNIQSIVHLILNGDSVPSLSMLAESSLYIYKLIAQVVVSFLIGSVWILTVVAVVNTGLGLQAAHAFGFSRSMGEAASRIVMLLVGGILVVASIAIANEVLTLVFH